MKEYLINQLIQEPNKKSFTPEIDFYDERFLSIESRNNKLATNKVFRTPYERTLFLKIYSKMRKILRHGNQFDVASKLKGYFIQAEKDGLFRYINQSEWNINRETGLLEKDDGIKVKKQIHDQLVKRRIFLFNEVLVISIASHFSDIFRQANYLMAVAVFVVIPNIEHDVLPVG